MRNLLLLSPACLAAISTALSTIHSRSDSPAVASAPIQRRTSTLHPAQRDRLRKRTGTVQVTLDNQETLYFANASVGTPAQDFLLHIDTGSSDLWVNAASSQICTGQQATACQEVGTYNANQSSTYKYVNSHFNVSYEDGSSAAGDYATDSITIGGLSIPGFQFGIGYEATTAQCVLGIGYPIDEGQVSSGHEQAYNNLPAAMAQGGAISANAFSLYLNDLEASTGSILFGGVDTKKFKAPLQTLPIVSSSGVYADFIIALTDMGQNGNVGSIVSNQAIPVLLDSGSSLSYLPNNIAQSIFQAFSAQWDDNESAAVVDCSLRQQTGTIDFTFSGATISVEVSELVVLASIERGVSTCILGISTADNTTPVLGDTFLRSAYVVYDLDNNEISIAATDFNSTESNVEQISKGSSGVPGATPVASPVTAVTGLSTGAGRIDTVNGAGSTGAAVPAITAPPLLTYGAAAAAVGLGALAF